MTFIFIGKEFIDAWTSIQQRESDLQSIAQRFSTFLHSAIDCGVGGEKITPALQNFAERVDDTISVFESNINISHVQERIEYLDKLDETIY